MFELDQIKNAHSKVKSGADFPQYVQDLIKLGVRKYSTYVKDGHTVYLGDNDYERRSDPKYAAMKVADDSNAEQFKHSLSIHQQGQTDYMTFCSQSAEAGVEKWTVDMDGMTCTYYDKAGNKMLEENILTP